MVAASSGQGESISIQYNVLSTIMAQVKLLANTCDMAMPDVIMTEHDNHCVGLLHLLTKYEQVLSTVSHRSSDECYQRLRKEILTKSILLV